MLGRWSFPFGARPNCRCFCCSFQGGYILKIIEPIATNFQSLNFSNFFSAFQRLKWKISKRSFKLLKFSAFLHTHTWHLKKDERLLFLHLSPPNFKKNTSKTTKKSCLEKEHTTHFDTISASLDPHFLTYFSLHLCHLPPPPPWEFFLPKSSFLNLQLSLQTPPRFGILDRKTGGRNSFLHQKTDLKCHLPIIHHPSRWEHP